MPPTRLISISCQSIAALKQRQGLKIASIEESASRNSFSNAGQFEQPPQPLAANGYGQEMPRLLAKDAQP